MSHMNLINLERCSRVYSSKENMQQGTKKINIISHWEENKRKNNNMNLTTRFLMKLKLFALLYFLEKLRTPNVRTKVIVRQKAKGRIAYIK